MTIKQWPKSERPRDRLVQLGPEHLSDAELLAVLIRSGNRTDSALGLARQCLQHFGDLRRVFAADHTTLCRVEGLGPACFAQFQAAMELARRCLREQVHRSSPLVNPQHTEAYLQAMLRDQDREVFCCLFLDNRHRVITYEELFRGSLTGTSVYPREVVKSALKHHAAALILAHNHPSGVAEPSHADRAITQRLQNALELVDIRVLDHLIIGDGTCVSFAKRGLI